MSKERLSISLISLAVMISVSRLTAHADFDHRDYAQVLTKFVNHQGLVDYQGLRDQPQALERYLSRLQSLSKETYQQWTSSQQVAFWINAYNAITLKVIIDHYPIKTGGLLSSVLYPKNSIRQIAGAWDKLAYPVMGEALTLDQIEHEILRKDFNQPGIHVALVCAARSCPYLRTEPYQRDRLAAQLAEQARIFFKQKENFVINREEDQVGISSIFKWFGKDFIPSYGSDEVFTALGRTERAVLNYALSFINQAQQDYLKKNAFDLYYLSYDWRLNDQAIKEEKQ